MDRQMNRYHVTETERTIYRRYASLALPRHTSYPTAPAWTTDYGSAEFRADLARAAPLGRPLSLYVHVPFCERLCYYCACTKEIVPPQKRTRADPGKPFLEALDRETGYFTEIGGSGTVRQVHLGGGSPTFLRPAQLVQLWQLLTGRFRIAPDAEIAVEIDPRVTTLEHLQTLRGLGFNRVSLGVQDFDPKVQRAVNRLQSVELVTRVVEHCRSLGFASVNFDLIYGLPFQTCTSMVQTLDRVLALRPDRVAFYRLAVIPEMFRWQAVFRHADLPDGDLTLDLNLQAINRFQEAGYTFIGLDHFARPGEALAKAAQDGSLRRNFQGMTTGGELDLLGLGPSAISQLDTAFAQNVKTTAAWCEAVGTGLAVERGLRLTAEDRLRRELLQQLYGHGIVRKRELEARFPIAFDDHFADELRRLRQLAGEGLIEMDNEELRVTAPLGRLLLRVVAAVFDAYLRPDAFRAGLAAHQSSRVG
jgi:oxygen-independent coproporphyrinogen-3 oxidase